MATNYPTSLDTGSTTLRTDITATTELDDAGFYHDEQHVNAHGAVIAVETKLGVGSSDASAAGAGTVLVHSGSGSTGWSAAATGVTSVGTLSSLTVSGDVTVDTDTLYVDSTNDRVGVGTTSPGAQLEIANTGAGQLYATADGFYVVQSKSQLDTLFLRSQGPVDISSDFDGGTTNDYIRFLTDNSTERMRIDSSGRVGIGTASPSRILDIQGASNPEIRLQSTDSSDPFLYFGDQVDPVRGGIGMDTSANALLLRGYNNVTRITINSSGNVGIGTTSPADKLHVGFTNGSAAGIVLTNSGHTVGKQGMRIGFDNDRLTIQRASDSGAWEANYVAIDQDTGNVGIGTTSPAGNFQCVSQNRAFTVIDSGLNNQAEAGFTTLGGTAPAFGNFSGYDLRFKAGTSRAGQVVNFYVQSNGNITVNNGVIQSVGTYNNTTGSSANMHVSSGGFFYRSTSSLRYKTNVETLEDQYADAILGLRPVWYRSLNDVDPEEWGYWGFIAEEVAEIDPRLVSYGVADDYEWELDENEQKMEPPVSALTVPEGVQYDRLVPHLVNLVARQRDQIGGLTARVEALEVN